MNKNLWLQISQTLLSEYKERLRVHPLNNSATGAPLNKQSIVTSKYKLGIVVMAVWCLMALTAQTGYIMPWMFQICHAGADDKQIIKTHTEAYTLFNLTFVEIISMTH